MEKQQTLRDLAYELETNVGSIGCSIETLVDIETLFGQLRADMDAVMYRGEICEGYYREHHRMVRVLSELLRYTIKDLNEEYEKTNKIKLEIFSTVVKENKESHIAGTIQLSNEIN